MVIRNLSESNSLISQYLKEIRSVSIQQDSLRFRRNIERIGELMAYEVSKVLHYAPEQVQTPIDVASVNTIQDRVVLATVLRAGLPFHQGFLNMFDHAENAFLSAYRKVNEHGDLEIVSEYMAAPSTADKTLILVDPMLATGMSMDAAIKALERHGQPAHIHLCCVIGAPEAVHYLEQMVSENVTLWCAAIDQRLNEHKYIVPGLGDAGDLCFGDKL